MGSKGLLSKFESENCSLMPIRIKHDPVICKQNVILSPHLSLDLHFDKACKNVGGIQAYGIVLFLKGELRRLQNLHYSK